MAYYFYVQTITSVDFQICISVTSIFSVPFAIFFENTKGILKRVMVMSSITAINFCRSHTWTLIKYWHIDCYLLWKMFPSYCRVWFFFKYIKEVLKQVRVILCRTDTLYHRNRLLVYSNSKFDKLKELHPLRIEKKGTKNLHRLEFFLRCRKGLKKINAQFMQNWCLVLL